MDLRKAGGWDWEGKREKEKGEEKGQGEREEGKEREGNENNGKRKKRAFPSKCPLAQFHSQQGTPAPAGTIPKQHALCDWE